MFTPYIVPVWLFASDDRPGVPFAEVATLPAAMLLVFALTLFLSATLLFILELMVGKLMLPLLGGTPAVWNTCMVFYQAVLLAGYAYAHYSTRAVGPRRQAWLHLVVLGLPLLFFAVTGALAIQGWLVQGREGNPIVAALLVLTASIGVPMFVICTSASVLTRWFSATDHPSARDPYFLYAASNLGSMIGLGAYPFFIEPNLTLSQQRIFWCIAFAMLALLTALCAFMMWQSNPAPEASKPITKPTSTPQTGNGGDVPASKLANQVAGFSLMAIGIFVWIYSRIQSFGSESTFRIPWFIPSAMIAGGVYIAGLFDKWIGKDSETKAIAPSRGTSDKVTSQRASTGPEVFPSAERKPVTWLRRLHWLTLAAVPSSLMLGATTYMSMDIAAIPMLWILPLMLYLLTFIIVFSVFDIKTQNIVVAITVWVLLLGLALVVAPPDFKASVSKNVESITGFNLDTWIGTKWFDEGSLILMLIRLGVLGAAIWAGWIFTLKDKELIHHVMVMVMPLLILLLMFIMYAEISATIWVKIALHLVTLFVVAMVCHGELARDRPDPEHLTDFFLTMSVGGVVGGMFNSLVAPVTFNSYIEYQIAMMVACLLVPPLGYSKDSSLARNADLALAAVFFLVGGVLLFAFYLDFFPAEGRHTFPKWRDMPWEHWNRAMLVFIPGLIFAVIAAWQGWGTPPVEPGEKPQNSFTDRVLDVVLPLGLLFLVLGLFWGLPSEMLDKRMETFAKRLTLDGDQFKNILIFGLPAVLCYTFVERNIRFGLGVGAIMLAAGMSLAIREGALYQERSFFGVLKVELGRSYYPEDRRSFPIAARYYVNRLVHGTTLHGKQFLEEDLRGIPSSYYHASGPVGMVMRGYNRYNEAEKRWPGIAVIGLGTGTVAAYANRGQRLDYYDIDQVVVDISYNQNRYFTYCEDAKNRGVDVGLILGDARLTCDPSNRLNRESIPEDQRGLPRLRPMGRWDPNAEVVVGVRKGANGQILKDEKGEPLNEVTYGAYKTPAPKAEYGENLKAGDKYGLMFIDAFSSDAIPVHLITREAVMIYLRRLEKDGIICLHISNRYLDLQPVLSNIVSDLRKNGVFDTEGNRVEDVPDLVGYHMSDDDEIAPGKSRSHWVVITRDVKNIERLRYVPMWQSDDGQLEALGAALWPSNEPAMMMASGLALACRGIAEAANKKAFEDERRTGPMVARTKWFPLDTLHDIDERNEADQKRLAQLEKEMEPITGRVKELDTQLKGLTKELEPLEKDMKTAEESVASLETFLKDPKTPDRADVAKKLDEAKKRAADLGPKFRKMTEEKADLTSAKAWWTERQNPLEVEQYRLKSRIDTLNERKRRITRVGVWTDDYSNLLSVFNK